MSKKDPRKARQSGLNMSPQAFMISASLSDGPKHGYAIKKQLAADTQGKVDMSYGTLYQNLNQMQDAGLIHHLNSSVSHGRIQKTYCLTDQGKASFNEQADIIKSLFNTKERREKQE